MHFYLFYMTGLSGISRSTGLDYLNSAWWQLRSNIQKYFIMWGCSSSSCFFLTSIYYPWWTLLKLLQANRNFFAYGTT